MIKLLVVDENMKKIVVAMAVVAIAGVSVFGLSKILAQADLPRVIKVCETKNGDLSAVNDGFSKQDTCKDKDRMVALGEAQVVGSGTGNGVWIGKIAFFDAVNFAVLDKNGVIWQFDGTRWVSQEVPHVPTRVLPAGVDVNSILSWGFNMFMTKSGDIYWWDMGTLNYVLKNL